MPSPPKSARSEKMAQRSRDLAANFHVLSDEAFVDGRTADAVLCISRATRHRMIKRAELTVYKFGGGNQRLKVGDLRQAMAKARP